MTGTRMEISHHRGDEGRGRVPRGSVKYGNDKANRSIQLPFRAADTGTLAKDPARSFNYSRNRNGRWSEHILYQFTGGSDGLNPRHVSP
jgi:hypothetical protein